MLNSPKISDLTKRDISWLNFDWSQRVDANLKNEIKFIIKSTESLAENKI